MVKLFSDVPSTFFDWTFRSETSQPPKLWGPGKTPISSTSTPSCTGVALMFDCPVSLVYAMWKFLDIEG